MLYFEQPNLFSKVIAGQQVDDFYELFNVTGSEYWDTHYNFGIGSLQRKKRVSKGLMDLLIINTIIPLKFCYAVQHGKDVSEEILELATKISSEENTVVKKFNSLKNISKSACQSQALLQLKTEYCDKNKCLDCAIGGYILGSQMQSRVNRVIRN
jgi:hypothetical protein